MAVAPSRQAVALAEIARTGIAADGVFASGKRTYSYGAHSAHVAVDPKTGHVQIVDYLAVEDVGRIINPLTLHGQCVGAVVQGLGGVFLEQFVYDSDGQLLTGSFADYLLPTASDFPSIRAIALEQKPSPHNPLGARGIYLFQGSKDTLFRIHGTNQPEYIGQAISSGCIRLTNEDVIDLYGRVKMGAIVVVLAPNQGFPRVASSR